MGVTKAGVTTFSLNNDDIILIFYIFLLTSTFIFTVASVFSGVFKLRILGLDQPKYSSSYPQTHQMSCLNMLIPRDASTMKSPFHWMEQQQGENLGHFWGFEREVSAMHHPLPLACHQVDKGHKNKEHNIQKTNNSS